MKTIADFKRKMFLGNWVESKLYYLNKDTGEYKLQRDYGERPVSIVQSNSFALKTDKFGDGSEWVDSWCEWPRLDQFEVLSDNSVKIKFNGGYLTYTFNRGDF